MVVSKKRLLVVTTLCLTLMVMMNIPSVMALNHLSAPYDYQAWGGFAYYGEYYASASKRLGICYCRC